MRTDFEALLPMRHLALRAFLLFVVGGICTYWQGSISGKDYLLTIGGGYEPAGNQASLEANVLFFQEVVSEKYPIGVEHQIFFADGLDSQEDLQVIAPSPERACLDNSFQKTA